MPKFDQGLTTSSPVTVILSIPDAVFLSSNLSKSFRPDCWHMSCPSLFYHFQCRILPHPLTPRYASSLCSITWTSPLYSLIPLDANTVDGILCNYYTHLLECIGPHRLLVREMHGIPAGHEIMPLTLTNYLKWTFNIEFLEKTNCLPAPYYTIRTET